MFGTYRVCYACLGVFRLSFASTVTNCCNPYSFDLIVLKFDLSVLLDKMMMT